MTLRDQIKEALQYCHRQGIVAELSLTQETGFSVTARAEDVEKLEHHQEKGFAVTVYADQRSASSSTSDLSPSAIQKAIEKAQAIARFTQPDEYAGLPEKGELAFQYPELDLYHPWSMTPEAAIDYAIEHDKQLAAADKRIKQSEGVSVNTYQTHHIFANTLDFIGETNSTYHSLNCEALAELNGEMERDYEYTVARDPAQLQSFSELVQQCAEQTVKRLGARKIHTQTCPVIFHASLARGLIGSFIRAISGGQLYRKASFLLDSLGKQIFPSFMTIEQKPHRPNSMGSAAFDAEGVKTQDRVYVKEGVLQSYVLGVYSARKLGLKSTGNAGGVQNLQVAHSDQDLKTLCQTMGKGLLVTELMGQGVKLLTGDYSRGAFGYWVENGEIQHPVHEITIAGNLSEMFQDIIAVGNDIDRRGSVHTGSILLKKMMISGS